MEKVRKTRHCWIWEGTVGTDGYGRFYLDPSHKSERAHRVSYLLANGEFDRMMLVLHQCDNELCVRPSHLYLGDHTQNMRDKVQRNPDWNHQSRKTHCKNGHKFTPENTKIRKSRYQRICRTCEREAQARYYERKYGT